MHLILQIGISQDTECVNTVGFPKLGHIFVLLIFTITKLIVFQYNIISTKKGS